MTVKLIITNLNKLHRVSESVDLSDEVTIRRIHNDLMDTANKHYMNCLGLAAPQISYQVRMFVMMYNKCFITIINPEIIKAKGQQKYITEGCLSRPGLHVKVARYQKIRVSFINIHGDLIEINMSNLHARIFQHEFDHLNGVVI